jgi:hypothetical protein
MVIINGDEDLGNLREPERLQEHDFEAGAICA